LTRHRTITGFVAVALLAVAATAATMKSHSPEGIVVAAGTNDSKTLTADEIQTASFDERWSALAAAKTETPQP
jgi:uncharacterized membrane protein YdfJ with MMPL/SSD domain